MTGRSRRFLALPGLLVVATLGAALTAAAPPSWTDDLSELSRADWTPDRAAHLVERGGFGATPEEIARLAAMSPRQAVDWLVDYERQGTAALEPFEESGVWDAGMDPFPPSRAEAVRIARERGESLGVNVLPAGTPRRLQPVVDKFFYGLRASSLETQRLTVWWASRMLRTNRPLEEKLTLFWHGHFATGHTKVRDYRMMQQQNAMFRANAAGSFRTLLVAVLKDPAMLVYLDNGENVKKHPNENFGRELLELFTMGVGNYGEQDVREAARSFTGWTNDVLAFKFDKDQHDFGSKMFLGKTGTWNGEDIIDLILQQPVTAEFMAAKLYRYFVREDLSDRTKTALGRTLRTSGYELKPLLKQIFLSKDFYSTPSVSTQIKSPVVLAISTYRKMGLTELPTIPDFGRMTSGLGQSLFDPPNVAGWAGGRTWITPATLLQRGNMFREVLFPDVTGFRAPDRMMPPLYARVGDNLAKGMNITEATKEGTGDAESNMQADRDEDFNTRYANYQGYTAALKRAKPIPRRPAELSVTAMVQSARATTVDAAVDHLVQRFLRVKLADKDRAVLVNYLRTALGTNEITPGPTLEPSLRELLYLVLSTPEYQLS